MHDWEQRLIGSREPGELEDPALEQDIETLAGVPFSDEFEEVSQERIRRIERETKRAISEEGFVQVCFSVLGDFEKGKDSFTRQPVAEGYQVLPESDRVMLRRTIPLLARIHYPKPFAQKVLEAFSAHVQHLEHPSGPASSP